MHPYRKWFLQTSALALAALAGICLFNYVIDPWGLNQRFIVEGINRQKPKLVGHAVLHHAAALQRIRPRTLIMGTSRANQGIRTDHPAWGDRDAFYNLAVSAATMHEIRLLLEAETARHKIDRLVMGLDFLVSFNINRPDHAETLEGIRAIEHPEDIWQSYLSREMTKHSLYTLRHQRGEATYLLERGESNPEYFQQRLNREEAGHRGLFLDMESSYIQGEIGKNAQPFALLDQQGRSTLDELSRVISLCRKQGIHLTLFISPSHARQWELIHALGLWSTFEEWKRMMVKLLDREAALHPGAHPIALWDFSGFNRITTEPVPASGVRKPMEYYWESSHYKRAAGDMVIERILGVPNPNMPADFGANLTERSLEVHLAHMRRQRILYHAQNPGESSELEALLLKIRAQTDK